jgi:rubrerythrin
MPATLEEFMAQALQMELDAAQRYNEFADMMDVHNNPDVGAWFRKMAAVEGKHADHIMAQMGWSEVPTRFANAAALVGMDEVEAAASDELHYLMQPWHVLQLALAGEERAERFFAQMARAATNESVRQAAFALQQEEHDHVELVKAWMLKVPQPDANWDQDPDPPRYDD